MAEAKAHLEERAAAVGVAAGRPRGAHRRRSPSAASSCATRLSEVEARLDGSMEARREAEVRRVELDAKQSAVDRLAALVSDRLGDRRDASSASCASAAAVRARPSGRPPRGSTTCATQRADAERRLEETARAGPAGRARRGRGQAPPRGRGRGPAARPRRRARRGDGRRAARRWPRAPRPPARVRELERELRLMGPINPLALEEYDALQERHTVPRRQQLDDVKALPARARQGDQGHRRRDRRRLRGGLRRRRRRTSSRCSRRSSRAGRAGCGSPTPTTCSRPASRSRPSRRARTCASSRCCPAASARSPRWPSCSRCSAAGPRPST